MRITCQHANEVLDVDFVAAIIDLNVVAVQVGLFVFVLEDLSREGIARVASHVVSKHKNNMRVWKAHANNMVIYENEGWILPLDNSVNTQSIGAVAIVKPKSGSRYL